MSGKKAVTIVIHKKGESEDPANFRPITLEPVTLKIFTACMRDKISEFLKENNYIEHNLQKGFIPKGFISLPIIVKQNSPSVGLFTHQ